MECYGWTTNDDDNNNDNLMIIQAIDECWELIYADYFIK